MHLWERDWGRGLVALGVGAAVFAFLALSPALWDSALLAGWDAGVFTLLIMTYFLIRGPDARHTWEQSQAREPETLRMLVVVIITSIVGLMGAIALSGHNPGRGQMAQSLHFAAGAIAVVEAWLLVHAQFGLYYARLYYDETGPALKAPDGDGATGAFRKGLEFPDGELVDYWAFMYYSFTIAMCYQTSDVTVTGPLMRRMTLLHAIISFGFVLVILSFTVNAIGTILSK